MLFGLVEKAGQRNILQFNILANAAAQGDLARDGEGHVVEIGLGTAAGIFKSVVSVLIIVICNAVAKRSGEERLF